MQRGDVIWVELPPVGGYARHEQAGTRPAVVVQTDPDRPELPTVVIVPLTTQTAALRFPGCFLVSPTPTNGLREPSVVLTPQVRAIDKRRVIRISGRLDKESLAEIDTRLRGLLGL